MFFSKKALFGAVASLAAVSSVAADDCSSGPWTDVLSIGGPESQTFCATKYKAGTVINGIEVWADKNQVNGIQFYYTDGTDSGLNGKQNGDQHQRFNWDPSAETIDQLKMWGNGKGQHLGHLYVHTTKGNSLDIGKDTNKITTYEIKTNAGVMLGAFGSAGGDNVDNLGFLFLKGKVTGVTVDDMKFSESLDQLNAKKEGISSVEVDSQTFTNANPKGTANITSTWTRSIAKTVSKTYTTTNSNHFGISDSISAEVSVILEIAKVTASTTLSYDYTHDSSTATSTTDTVTLSYALAVSVAPGASSYCQANAQQGTYKGDYTCTVNVHLDDGSTFGFGSSGTLNQVAWSDAEATCQDKPFSKAKRAVQFSA